MENHTLPDGRIVEYADLGDPDGAAVVYLHGTPNTAGSAVFWDDAARQSRVRLVAVTRPGYGASTLTHPGLASVGRDVADLTHGLGIDQYVVVGVSGGGPYALAAAAEAPDRVPAVVVVAGPGSYHEVAPDRLEPEDVRAIELMAAGDTDGAVAVVSGGVSRDMGPLQKLRPEEFDAAMAGFIPPGEPNFFADKPEQQAVFGADMRRALTTFDGFVRDNVSWNGPWDIDLGGVRAHVELSYGAEDHMVPVAHGQWLAERLPSARLTVHPGAGHGQVTMGMADWHFAAIAAYLRP